MVQSRLASFPGSCVPEPGNQAKSRIVGSHVSNMLGPEGFQITVFHLMHNKISMNIIICGVWISEVLIFDFLL